MNEKKVRRLFLVDGLGAAVSAVLLGVVLVRLYNIFGIPASALYLLALVPCLFLVYDLYCYFIVKKDLGIYLKVIAIANVLYCFLSLGLAIYHRDELTVLGWGYILIEILVICVLSTIEWKVAEGKGRIV